MVTDAYGGYCNNPSPFLPDIFADDEEETIDSEDSEEETEEESEDSSERMLQTTWEINIYILPDKN